MSDDIELRWPGKLDAHGQRTPVPRPGATLRARARYPAGPSGDDRAPPHRLVEGDNLFVLDALAREQPGSVDLVYIDPPFATGGRFEVVTPVGSRQGEELSLRQPAYSDAWPGGVGGLLAMLDPRLRLIHELLAPHGSLYLHVDPTVGHAVKLQLDEIFGPGCFQREIVWRIGWVSGFKTKARNWIRNHDLIFFYVKDPARFTFNKRYVPHPPGYRRRDGSPPRGKGVPLDDVWNAGEAELSLRGWDSLDSIQIKSFSTEKTGYATQKNESLLARIIEASSNPGDLVLDAFCGSGTTLAVADALGRRFVGGDTGRAAVHIATGRWLAGERRRALQVLDVAEHERAAWQREQGGELTGPVQARWREVTGDPRAKLLVQAQVDAAPNVRATTAAWRWSLPVPVVDDGDAVMVGEVEGRRPGAEQLVLQRALLDPRLGAGSSLAFAERGRVAVRLRGLATGRVEVELCGLWYPHRERLPPPLREPSVDPLRLVERWAIGWSADDEAVRVDEVYGRFERDRSLPDRSPVRRLAGGQGLTLHVLVHDCLHREHRLRVTLAPRGKGFVVERAIAIAEG